MAVDDRIEPVEQPAGTVGADAAVLDMANDAAAARSAAARRTIFFMVGFFLSFSIYRSSRL